MKLVTPSAIRIMRTSQDQFCVTIAKDLESMEKMEFNNLGSIEAKNFLDIFSDPEEFQSNIDLINRLRVGDCLYI